MKGNTDIPEKLEMLISHYVAFSGEHASVPRVIGYVERVSGDEPLPYLDIPLALVNTHGFTFLIAPRDLSLFRLNFIAISDEHKVSERIECWR